MLVACSKQELAPARAASTAEDSQLSSVSIPGVLYVKFADILSDVVEESSAKGKLHTRSLDLNTSFDEVGVTSCTRLFPFAGEFEERTRKAGLHRWYKITFNEDFDPSAARKTLLAVNGVQAAVNALSKRLETIPFDDTYAAQQWHYDNPNIAWADVNVLPVWENYTTGDPDVIVAVVDSGVDLEHEDLEANALAAGDGGSKCFVTGKTGYTIYPDDHGTHVAGTIAAVNNNGKGVCGIAGGDAAAGKKGVRLMSCQIMHEEGKVTLQGDDAAAIVWAADHGAVICNNSWGFLFENSDGSFNEDAARRMHEFYIKPNSGNYADPLKDAIDYFNEYAGCDALGNQTGPMKGGLVLFAAGNDGAVYGAPAGYSGAIAVGSIANTGVKSSFSNYGDWVDICAPGGESSNIWSTLPGNSYGRFSGTSMACPHVAGVAALVVSACGGPGFTREDLIAKLIGGANNIDFSLSYRIGPLVDALGAVEYDPDATVPAVSEFDAKVLSNSVDFELTVPAYETSSMNVYGFNILASKSESDWSDAVSNFILNPGYKAGEIISARLTGLDFETAYYVAVEAVNYNMTPSVRSAAKAVQTGINHAPVFSTSYTGDYSLAAWRSVSIPFEVADPDEHPLQISYEKGSKAEEFLKVSETSFVLKITGTAAEAGSYTCTVTADDGFGGVTSHEITYTILPNGAPQLKKKMQDIWLTGNGKSFSLSLSEYISDPDGESLNVSSSVSGANKVATVSKSGNTLTVKATADYGVTTVSITATDACGESVKTSFNVLIRPEEELASAYPNPVTDNLSVATGIETSNARIRIISESGSAVFGQTLECSAFKPAKIRMDGVAPGRYTLIVEYDGTTYSKTIIKL